MSERNDGGPAFACAAENGHQPGMSLRDYIATHALAGMMAVPDAPELNAAYAYRIADAMLAERSK